MFDTSFALFYCIGVKGFLHLAKWSDLWGGK